MLEQTMPFLIISDESKRPSFRPIEVFRKELMAIKNSKVDLFIYDNTITLEKSKKSKKNCELLLEEISNTKYDVIIVSLQLQNLKKILLKKSNILKNVTAKSPNSTVFIYGAKSVLKRIPKEKNLDIRMYTRKGVAKLTQEFKEDILEHIISSRIS